MATSDQQIKIINIDLCELYNDSCESCLKVNKIRKFRTYCIWHNGSCNTAATSTSISMNCNFFKPDTVVSLSPSYLPTTTVSEFTITNISRTPSISESRTTSHYFITSFWSSPSTPNEKVSSELILSMKEQDVTFSNLLNTNSSSSMFFSDLLKMKKKDQIFQNNEHIKDKITSLNNSIVGKVFYYKSNNIFPHFFVHLVKNWMFTELKIIIIFEYQY